ncbi:MAG: hypothetical protein J6K25_06985 [Thermoguttaceae bacterium]|nr:hypothetical protein [Thermoguttaceae bacterium]
MRNFLIALMLCVLTLTISNVFAEDYDETRRTERFGLSFYDGRPLYIIRFGCDVVDRSLTRADLIRVHTGSNLTDYGVPNGSGVIVDYVRNDAGKMYEYGYSFYGVDENGDLIPLHSATFGYPYYQEMLDLLSPRLSPGDLAVETYDNILPNAQDWSRRGILLAVALFVLSTGLNKFRELTSGEAQTTDKDAKKSDGAASPKAEKPKLKKKIDASEYLELDHESSYRLRTPRELREERAQEDREHTERQRVMTEEEALREAYISGDYWGKSFSDEVRASNRELYEAFDKMDPFTRRLLIQKFDEMSFTKEATLLKSYNKDVYGFADDNIGNPFEGDDEEDGEPPF